MEIANFFSKIWVCEIKINEIFRGMLIANDYNSVYILHIYMKNMVPSATRYINITEWTLVNIGPRAIENCHSKYIEDYLIL